MTEQITVPRATWDAMREVLKHGIREMNLSGKAKECMPLHQALTAANAVSHPQATEPAGCKRDPLDLGQYVNDAHISANDKPVAVIEKLQAVINERAAHHG